MLAALVHRKDGGCNNLWPEQVHVRLDNGMHENLVLRRSSLQMHLVEC